MNERRGITARRGLLVVAYLWFAGASIYGLLTDPWAWLLAAGITALILVPLWLFRRYWWYRKPTPHVDRTDGFTGGPDHHVIHVISGEAVVSVNHQQPQSVRRGDRLFIQKSVGTNALSEAGDELRRVIDKRPKP